MADTNTTQPTVETAKVSRNSLFDIATDVEGATGSLGLMIEMSLEKIADSDINSSASDRAHQTEMAISLLGAALLYLEKIKEGNVLLYKQAAALHNN